MACRRRRRRPGKPRSVFLLVLLFLCCSVVRRFAFCSWTIVCKNSRSEVGLRKDGLQLLNFTFLSTFFIDCVEIPSRHFCVGKNLSLTHSLQEELFCTS
jgi:hypothetical protein